MPCWTPRVNLYVIERFILSVEVCRRFSRSQDRRSGKDLYHRGNGNNDTSGEGGGALKPAWAIRPASPSIPTGGALYVSDDRNQRILRVE